MTQKADKVTKLKEEIKLTKQNIRLLAKAKKDCDCSCEGGKIHYHVLVNYDAESGDQYIETSDAKHQRFIEKLRRELAHLESRLKKLRAHK